MTREDIKKTLRPITWDEEGNGWVELSDGFYLAFYTMMYDCAYHTGYFIGEVQKISKEMDSIPEGGLSPIQDEDEDEEDLTYEAAKRSCEAFYLDLVCDLLNIKE